MILENTPYPIVMRTMQQEKPKVLYFIEKESSKIAKIRFHEKQTYYSIYTHQISKNNYMYWGGRIVTQTWFQDVKNHNFRAGSCLVVNTSNGERMIFTLGKKNENGRLIDTLVVYTSHFFRRYRERCIKDEKMSTNDLICNFLVRNSELIPLDYKKVVRKWEKYKDCAALQANDGVILGTEKLYNDNGYEFYVVENNTFIPETLLKDDQSDALFTDEKMRDVVVKYAKEVLTKFEVTGEIS